MRRILLLYLCGIVIATTSTSQDVPQAILATIAGQGNDSSITTEAVAAAPTPSSLFSLNETGTCLSRTANYVTHTLPQQCLRTDWSRSKSDTASLSSTGVASSQNASSSAATVLDPDHAGAYTAAGSVSTASEILVETIHADPTSIAEPQQSQESSSIESMSEDADSPLDTAHFLSFEDWKRQNLAKVGQSSDNLGPRPPIEAGRKAPIVNALDSFGDENEIDLDFAGFGSSTTVPEREHEPPKEAVSPPSDGTSTAASPALQALRPRDAGRTCKERTNYASFDCAATVLKSNPECKSASSVLVENKDSYMLNKCSAKNKFFIVELCNDILIDTVVLANYEFFSSIFRQFRVSVSDRYPVKAEKWKDLGTFEASNTREVQAFLVENPLIWARYIRIEFLTHYGSEYYCPVSLLRVHGTTMMEEFRNQEELARGEVDEQEEDEPIVAPTKAVEPDAQSTLQMVDLKETAASEVERLQHSIVAVETNAKQTDGMIASTTSRTSKAAISAVCPAVPAFQTASTCPLAMTTAMTTVLTLTKVSEARISTQASSTPTSNAVMVVVPSNITGSSNTTTGHSSDSTTSQATSSLTTNATVSKQINDSSSVTASLNSSSSITANSSESTSQTSVTVQSVTSSTKDTTSRISSSSSSKTVSSASSAPPAQPSTQESFFKSISKRLQQLESNSTLGLQYIEEQSRILRDAFSKVEKRQINMTSSFLSNLNKTVMTELAGFRQAYDQLWQSTVIELEGQRQQHKVEMTALSSRLTLAVDELVWQKRMGIVQSTLLLLCLALVLFGRGPTGTSDVSLMQHVMLRSQTAFRSGTGSEANSPIGSRSPVSLFRRKLPLWGGESRWKDSEVQSITASIDDSPIEPEPEAELEEALTDDQPVDDADVQNAPPPQLDETRAQLA